MAEVGFFLLGFIIVFLGGLYFIYNWEIFDIYDNEDEDWD
tara:strand:- start:653 stop:772 length:120 start_codon:yes stop_codon:yes gene_type:complete